MLRGGVSASKRSAGVGGGRVVVVTILVAFTRLPDVAISGLRVAGGNLSSSARAVERSVHTVSGLEIATVGGAHVSVVAVLLAHAAVSVLAAGGGAMVRSNAEWSVHASLVLDVVVDSAGVVIVTVRDHKLALVVVWVALVLVASVILTLDLLIDAPTVWVAASSVARGWRRADDWSLHHSLESITLSLLALVALDCSDELSTNVNNDALSGLGVAVLFGANVVVSANLGLMDALSSGLAATVLSASVSVVAAHCLVVALSGLAVTSVDGAWVAIVTVYLVHNALSSLLAAVGREALVLSLALFDGEHASLLLAAGIDGARVLIVAHHWSLLELSAVGVAHIVVASVAALERLDVVLGIVDTSLLWMAGVLGARVVISAADWSEHALSGL